MSAARDFLVEIGTEELPPKALRLLMDAFADSLVAALDDARLEHGAAHRYASPRRLAVLVEALAGEQPSRRVAQKGPPVSVAFDASGKLTAAGNAFARKCGVKPGDLARTITDKGEWLSCEVLEPGQKAATLLPDLVEAALAALPIPRRMRWGAGDAAFVRPVHWVVMLHGSTALKAKILGIKAGNKTRGHRFMAAGPITIAKPADYLGKLEAAGHVIADFERRRELVKQGVQAAARAVRGSIVNGEALYDEVASLVEWPVPLTGSFNPDFLELPREVVISTLTGHQRYFPVANKQGELLPYFITVANIESSDPDQVRSGNERVVLPRLADAAFFWENDRRSSLATRFDSLREVVYQHGLGSLADKSARVATLAEWIATGLKHPPDKVLRAATLAKCDLITGLVGEFPDLQGTMGQYYARHDGEPDDVADAIGEHYLPRFAGDTLPASVDGRILALADRLDTLAGIFTIGKKPTGNRDPFGLRRAALGIVRILVECGMDLDLVAMVAVAAESQPAGKLGADEVKTELLAYINERLRRYFLDRDTSLATETFDAVLVREPRSLVDFELRLLAVQAFIQLESASSLAAANKRIANILKQADAAGDASVKEKLLKESAELALWDDLRAARESQPPLLERREYTAALAELAKLRGSVDNFFDTVMVMADDKATRTNRLALLSELRALFLNVADISRLAIA
ncbi:MAG: glycine--tRNA ligase subunit beta [Gammaproteobacteria bacterium]|nr:glycine--tRNA ligase subunit beta [Gammaproteobacteria bacterium]MDH5323539.1 glycine--tRNA ligase subunit beta [Gammaproteobacteria bacterium]